MLQNCDGSSIPAPAKVIHQRPSTRLAPAAGRSRPGNRSNRCHPASNMLHRRLMLSINKIAAQFFLFFLSVFLVLPGHALAIQSHGAPEGIYVHQLAHIFFLAALCYLFWDIRRSSFPGKSWRYLQYFCVLMAIWNVVAFTGHIVGTFIGASDIIKESGHLSTRIAGPITPTKLIYYFTKLDHIFSVPALFCLYLCMRSLYLRSCKEENK